MPCGTEKSFVDFAKSLPPAVLDQLYTQPTTCIAVYRSVNRNEISSYSQVPMENLIHFLLYLESFPF